ncbi:MAG TPA: hypothetical protein VGP72_11135 [Planctomycetota bacterium]|jgi:murein endopeptidase
MAKGQFHSAYQKGIIKRYYENKEDLSTQKLGEIISDLYLETDKQKINRKWESAHSALLALGANKVQVEKICAERNLPALAKLAEELF